jgi:CBS domain-containing protein
LESYRKQSGHTRKSFRSLEESNTLKEAIPFFAQRVHRVAVVEPTTGKVQDILSQKDLIHFAATHLEEVMPFSKDIPVIQSGLMQSSLVSVDPDVLAVDAFRMMVDKHLSSLGVVLEEVWVGAINISDIKV